MKKILIFTYLERHFKKMLPIIKELKKNKNVDLTVLFLTEAEKKLAEKEKIQYKNLEDFTDKKKNSDFDLGWALEPLINAIDRIKPDLFMAIEVNYILRNAIRYCKSTAIPTLITQHGTSNEYSLHAFAPFEGNYFAAWGDFTKEFLIKNGVKSDKIIITGGPTFDETLNLKPDKEKIGKLLGIDPKKNWCVFTTQDVGPGNIPSKQNIHDGISEIAKRADKYHDWQIIFQVHPSQQKSDVEKIIGKSPKNVTIAKYGNTEELIAASSAVITFFSTTSFDAVILQKPLMLISLGKDKDFLPFVKMRAAYGAYSKNEISETFDKLINYGKELKPGLENAANYVNFKNDGQALNRVINLIYKILSLN